MGLRDTIEAVKNGAPGEVARLANRKVLTPFAQRLQAVHETVIRKAAGVNDADVPTGHSVSKEFWKDVGGQLSEPVKSAWEHAKEKNQMPVVKRAVEDVKDAGNIVKSVAKSAGRLGTSAVDATQMLLRMEADPVEWEKMPVLKNVPSYQRQAELKAQAGVPLSEIIANAARDIAVDTLSVYGTVKGVKNVDSTFINKGKTIPKPTKELRHEMSPKVRTKVISDAMKDPDFKDMFFVEGKKNLLKPKVAQGRLDDYAQVMDKHAHGFGARLRMNVDVNNVHYRNGTFVEIHREAQKLLGDTANVKVVDNAVSGGSGVKILIEPKKMVPHPAVKEPKSKNKETSKRFKSEIDMVKRGEIEK